MELIRNISKTLFKDADFARFQFPWVLYCFLLLIAFVIVFTLISRFQNNQLKKIGSESILKKILPHKSKNRGLIRFIIWTLGLAFIIIGTANLQFGDKKQEVKEAGIDLMICLDVSQSMMAEDIKPYRLKRAKLAINKILDNLGSDRIGIVIFAGQSYLQLPLTNDHSAAKMYLDNISTDIIPVQGTNIASAIEIAQESFPDGSPTNKAIIIISDGEEHDGKAIELAEGAADDNIKVFTIGLGSLKGSTIPVYRNGKRVGIKKDKRGSTVISRINENALKMIAKAGNGRYVSGTNVSLGLKNLLVDIGNIEKTEYNSKEFTSYDSKYQYFLGIGLSLLILEFLVLRRKGKWLNK